MPDKNSKRVSKSTPPSSSKSSSSYTYTGCWTCRRRHIKCDEGKPSCNRCIKANFECQGYDFKFAGSDSSRSFRRPVAPGSNARQVALFTNAEVSDILDELDAVTDSVQKGPFSVLSFDDQATEKERSSPAVDLAFHTVRPKRESLSSSRDSEYASPQSSPLDHGSSLALSRTSYSGSPPMVQEPHLLSVSGRQSELFEHWTSFLCYNLSPLTSSVNPFRYTYPSLALEGLTVTQDMATARLAVFHGICGTAAWSLSRLKQDDPSYHALSVYHDQMALRFIQQTIERPDGLQDAAIPAAIMSCLTGDTISRRLDLWGRHLRGGYRCLLAILAQHRIKDRTISRLCEQYLLGAAFGNFGTAAETQILWDAVLLDEPLYIEECHCITKPMLQSVIAINLLAASPRRKDPNEVEAVRIHLHQSMPKFEEPLRHHLSYAYYFAIMIHFSRSLFQAVNTEQLAAKAIDHLEWAKETARGNCGQILMWLLFKIGPECASLELRSRLLSWCNSHLRVNINNMDSFISHLQKTWAVSAMPVPETTNFTIEEIKTERYDDNT